MPLYDAPREFVARLKAQDSLLRIRWSDWERRWRIERKVTRGRWVDPTHYRASSYEDYVAARDGYVSVLYCHKNQLDDRVFLSLWYSDLWRRGGAGKVADQMESAEAMKKAASRAKFLDETWMAAKAYKDYANRVRVLPENARHTAPKGGMSIVAGSQV